MDRLDPLAALEAIRAGATLIDIRSDSQIAEDGVIPDAIVIPRNVLEWRLDPASDHRHARAPHLDEQVIVMCDEGYQSSLAAATLQQLGFIRATDLEGGFQAWRAAGLPAHQPANATDHAAGRAPELVHSDRLKTVDKQHIELAAVFEHADTRHAKRTTSESTRRSEGTGPRCPCSTYAPCPAPADRTRAALTLASPRSRATLAARLWPPSPATRVPAGSRSGTCKVRNAGTSRPCRARGQGVPARRERRARAALPRSALISGVSPQPATYLLCADSRSPCYQQGFPDGMAGFEPAASRV